MSTMLVAGCETPVATLTKSSEDPTLVTATILDEPYTKTHVEATYASFCVAKKAPVFYGANKEGSLVAIMCNVMSFKIDIVSWAFPDTYVEQVVCASEDETILFMDRNRAVWLVNMRQPDTLLAIGRAAPNRNIVAGFAAAPVAVIFAKNPKDKQGVRFVVASLESRYQATWGVPDAEQDCSAPDWALCCFCDVEFGGQSIKAIVAGHVIILAHFKAALAGPHSYRSTRILTAKKTPVCTVATKTGDELICYLSDTRLVTITKSERSITPPGIIKALTLGGATLR